MLWTELLKALLAACSSLRRSPLRSDCAPAMSLRSFLIVLRLLVTASVVTVDAVRFVSWSTCLPMLARLSHTVVWAASALLWDESPHAPSASTSIAAATAQSKNRIRATCTQAAPGTSSEPGDLREDAGAGRSAAGAGVPGAAALTVGPQIDHERQDDEEP